MNKEKIISLSLVGAIGLGSCVPAMAVKTDDEPPAKKVCLGSSLEISQPSEENKFEVLSEADDKTIYAKHEEIEKAKNDECYKADKEYIEAIIACEKEYMQLQKLKCTIIESGGLDYCPGLRRVKNYRHIEIDENFKEKNKKISQIFDAAFDKARKIREEIDKEKKEELKGVTEESVIEAINREYREKCREEVISIVLSKEVQDAEREILDKTDETEEELLKEKNEAIERAKEKASELHKALDEELKLKENENLESLRYKIAKTITIIRNIVAEELKLKFDKAREVLSKEEKIEQIKINQDAEEKCKKIKEDLEKECIKLDEEYRKLEKMKELEHEKIEKDLEKSPEEKKATRHKIDAKIRKSQVNLYEQKDELIKEKDVKLEEIEVAKEAMLEKLSEKYQQRFHEVEDTRLAIEKAREEKCGKLIEAFKEVESTFEEPEKKSEAIANLKKVFAEVEKEITVQMQKIQERQSALIEMENIIKKCIAYKEAHRAYLLGDDKLKYVVDILEQEFYRTYKAFYNKLNEQPELYKLFDELFGEKFKTQEMMYENLKRRYGTATDTFIADNDFELKFLELAEDYMALFGEIAKDHRVWLEITDQEYNEKCINTHINTLRERVMRINGKI